MVRSWMVASFVVPGVLAMTSAAMSQTPIAPVPPMAPQQATAASAPASSPVAVSPAPCPCGPVTCTTCAPQVEKVTRTHHLYRCKCRTICLTCKPLEKKGCGKDGCAEACAEPGCCGEQSCGKPREVRVLIKRFVKEEKCELHCKPHELPCGTTPCPAPPAP